MGDKMRVLVACDESQMVCKAFREKGHEAYSCDIVGKIQIKGADDYERAIEQTEHDALYEPTYNSEDGSM